MKHEINEAMLKAMEAGAEALRNSADSIRRELKDPEKQGLIRLLEPAIEKHQQNADLLEGFAKRTRFFEANHDRM